MSLYYGPSDYTFQSHDYRPPNCDPMERILKLITEQNKQITALKELEEKNSLAIDTLTKEVGRISQSLEEERSTAAATTPHSYTKLPRNLSVHACTAQKECPCVS